MKELFSIRQQLITGPYWTQNRVYCFFLIADAKTGLQYIKANFPSGISTRALNAREIYGIQTHARIQ